MTVYVLIREEQSAHGFIDASVVGLFRTQRQAKAVLKSSIAEARDRGFLVCGDPGAEPDWEVSWNMERHPLQ
jgi:hypothetical protein